MEGGVQHRRWETGSSNYSFRTSASSFSDMPEAAVTASPPHEETVFVAVAEELKAEKNTLTWTIQNLAKDVSKIVIAHVHVPASMIPLMGTKFHVSRLKVQEVNAFRQLERAKTEKKLDEYLLICSRLKVRCEKVLIEMDDVAKGLEELIVLHGITKLVMGAAADKHYSKKMKTPKSKKALKLMEKAAPSCKIWFICKGILICTREANTIVPAIPPSPAMRTGAMSILSGQMRSMKLSPKENEVLSSNASPVQDPMNRPRSEVGSPGMGTTPPPPSFEPSQTTFSRRTRMLVGSDDSWDEFGRRSQSSGYGSPWANDDVASSSGSAPLMKDDATEVCSAMHRSLHESDDDNQFSSPSQEDPGVEADMYEKLKEALNEAMCLKKEAYEESNKRRKAEKDLLSVLQKFKESENVYLHEMKQRKAIEEMLTKERQEIELTKRQQEEIYEQLHDANEQKLALECRIAELDCAVKEHEDKLEASKYLLQSLQANYDKLLHERDVAVQEAEELRHEKEQTTSMSAEALNTKFSFSELRQATQSFDESLKIGEGGFGSVYKGFLRNTTVAIKLLHPESLQGQSEFHQEVAVLSRVRHPNLVTLIGACPEAYSLVYEFLPYGSLEDRIVCTNNTAPLSWQVRTRIIGEICSALVFLHSNEPHPVVHGDLKPSNILLDANFVSKLGDFGICHLLMQSNTSTTITSTTMLYRTTNPTGTFAYMDPEFVSTGELTPQSDVYSFGIIILRLLTGKQPLNIAAVVDDALEEGNLHSIIDKSAGDWPFVQANQLAHLGLRCAELSRKRRPDLALEVWRLIEPMMKAASLSVSPPLLESVSASDYSYAPSYFICPIFQEIMRDPHVAADGFTYEAEAIKGWLDSGHDTSPMTNLTLSHSELIPNRALRSAILEWLQQQRHHR